MLSNLITKASTYSVRNPELFLKYTAAGTFTLSTLSQATGLKINKEIPAKEKKVLIFQELFNGGLQLATFLTVATAFEKFGKKLVDQGKIVGEGIAKGNPTFRKGIAVGFSMLGTVIAFNIITPLLRNPLAYYFQKHFDKNKLVQKENQHLAVPIIPAVKLDIPIGLRKESSPFDLFEYSLRINKLPSKDYRA